MKKVCHITTVHPRNDLRILYKQLSSLNKSSYNTFLIVADGKGNDNLNGTNIIDIGLTKNRLKRFLFSSYKAFKVAKKINASVYQIHDPELLFIAFILKKIGKIVIYDSHEDLPRQLITKPYLPKIINKPASSIVEYIENLIVKRLDGIICATPNIRKRFEKINSECIEIFNFPILSQSPPTQVKNESKEYDIVYIGHISILRGLDTIKYIAKNSSLKIALAGIFSPENLQNEIIGISGIDFLGYLSKEEITKILQSSKLGFVVLQPTPSYYTSYPIKMFEYFQVGLPVIASNFPLWKEIVENDNLGICVDPLNNKLILESIVSLINDYQRLEEMSKNGQKIILEKYNWNKEEIKLVKFYNKL